MNMYIIKGEDYLKGKVQKIGQAIAVIVDKEWLGKRVVVIKEGTIKQYVDEKWDNRKEAEGEEEKRKQELMESIVVDILKKAEGELDEASKERLWEIIKKERG